MSTITLQQGLISPTQKPSLNSKELSRKSSFCLKNLQLLANFSQAALDLLQIPFYRNIKAAKQYLNMISAQERYEKLFKNPSQTSSLELSFNKVHTVSSLILIPIVMSYYNLNLHPAETPSSIQSAIKTLAPYALTSLTVLGLIKTAFSVKNLAKEVQTSFYKRTPHETVSWKHNSALVLCESAKLSLNFARLLAPKGMIDSIKLFYNLNTLILCPLNALKLYKQEQQYDALLYSKQHAELLSEIVYALNASSQEDFSS